MVAGWMIWHWCVMYPNIPFVLVIYVCEVLDTQRDFFVDHCEYANSMLLSSECDAGV